VTFCGEATSGKPVKATVFKLMIEVVKKRDCCLTNLPNILERSGLRRTNSEALIKIARWFA